MPRDRSKLRRLQRFRLKAGTSEQIAQRLIQIKDAASRRLYPA